MTKEHQHNPRQGDSGERMADLPDASRDAAVRKTRQSPSQPDSPADEGQSIADAPRSPAFPYEKSQ